MNESQGTFSVLRELIAYDQLQTIIMDEFEKANPTVEVVDVRIGNNVLDDIVRAYGDFWLKVTTKDHGWLHVYLNKDTWKIEWY